jgi:hypothetical protein
MSVINLQYFQPECKLVKKSTADLFHLVTFSYTMVDSSMEIVRIGYIATLKRLNPKFFLCEPF